MAQLSVGAKMGYGAHGVNLETGVSGKPLMEDQVPLWLPNAGVVLSFNNKMNAGLQMELNYAPKGWREEKTDPDTFFVRQINYLEVPIFSHFEIGQKALRIVIMAGPYFAFKLSETSDSSNYTYITSTSTYNHYYLPVKEVDFGIKAVLGLRYNINPKLAIFSEVRYDIEMAGGSDIFYERPNGISASRLKEIGGTFGILWHIIPLERKKNYKGYTPKENLYDFSN